MSTASTLELATIVMKLESRSDSDDTTMLTDLLHLTSQYLDDYFKAYYSKSEPNNIFGETSLTANFFGIQGADDSFSTTVEFDGEISFNSEPTPSQAFINMLLLNAFQETNLDRYIENTLSSDDAFLNKITNIVIEVNNEFVDSYSPTTPDQAGTPDKHENESSLDYGEIVAYAAAGIIGAAIVLGAFCCCRCFCGRVKRQVDEEHINVKSIEVPEGRPERPQPRTHQSNSRSYNKARKQDRRFHGRERSPSPVRSLASQDSSKFTYNPAGLSRDIATLSLGSLSNINIELPNMDLEAWQRQNTISPVTPAPFGHDISAIENRDRDLSLIEEGDEPVLKKRETKPRHHTHFSSSSSRGPRVSRPRHHSRLSASQSSFKAEYPVCDSSTEESSTTSGDVISELKNLSLQIDRHRRARTSRN